MNIKQIKCLIKGHDLYTISTVNDNGPMLNITLRTCRRCGIQVWERTSISSRYLNKKILDTVLNQISFDRGSNVGLTPTELLQKIYDNNK